MKIDILCEGKLNKNIENDICDLYLNRISSLKKSGILKVEIKKITNHKNYKIKRVILCEQIYRCATILAKHPYHRY